jgi:hypothetical protein
MRAGWLMTAAMAAGLLAVPDQAAAGGSWLETEERYYSPGGEATARGTFGPGQLEGDIADGPYHAYLVPGYRWFEKPGPIPGYAIPLGPIAIRPTTGNYCCWVATLTFTVPEVSPGRYSIEYCNNPCTVNGIGDLMGGSFFVGDTEQEARLMGRIDRLERKVEALARTKRDLRKAMARAERLEEKAEALAQTRDDLQHAEAALAEARERYTQLRDRLITLLDAEPPVVESGDGRLSPWAVVVAVIVLAGGVWYRRRLGSTAIPDFVPDELVQDAQVPPRQPMTSSGRPAMSMPAPPRTKS